MPNIINLGNDVLDNGTPRRIRVRSRYTTNNDKNVETVPTLRMKHVRSHNLRGLL